MAAPVHRGLMLAAHKQAREQAIIVAPVGDELILLLDQQGVTQLQACVTVGQPVFMGQVIATAQSQLGAHLHSPVSGWVRAIEPHTSLKADAGQTGAIHLANDHLDTRDPSLQPLTNWSALPPLAVCEQLARGGIVGLGGAVFPSAIKLATHQHHAIEYLLINGVECEPYICCDDRLMRERAQHIAHGVQILMHAAQAAQCKIAIEADKPEALAAMRAAVNDMADARMEVVTIPCAYPSGDEGQLITMLTGREIPRDGLPTDIGVIVQNVATAYACAQWLDQAQPLISRIVTVTGSGVQQPGNFEVRIGMRIDELLAACEVKLDSGIDTLIMGGAMMGRTLAYAKAPIVKASNCLIVTAHAALKPAAVELPCIRCGDCADACPVYLLPQQLLRHARDDNRQALQDLGLIDCIECGCCDYVCPSKIRLATRFHAAKQTIFDSDGAR